jgi:hypothetical protein
MQQKVVFKSKGLNCSVLFYLPDNFYSATDDVKLPAIAMAHGIATLKEMGLPQYAERFAPRRERRHSARTGLWRRPTGGLPQRDHMAATAARD